MILENQTSSLELSKKLKELGVKQESLFYHHCELTDDTTELIWSITTDHALSGPKYHDYISAFTVAELGEMLKRTENFYQIETYWSFEFNQYRCTLLKAVNEEYGEWGIVNSFYEETEADARSKMLIYLIENNLIQK